MTKIDVISGFLGAGKTTLIKKLIQEAFQGEKLVLIENEFGEIGIDGGFLKDSGIQITEMNSGCICCSLVGDFGEALGKVLDQFAPDRVIIEPSGVGKLSDVIRAVQGVRHSGEPVHLNSATTVVDAVKSKMYMKNFGEFFNNQVESANTIVLSRSQKVSAEKLEACVADLKSHNGKAVIITTPWDELEGRQILAAMEQKNVLMEELLHSVEDDHHNHHHYDHGEECSCGHEHEHHEHHHHDHGEECSCGHEHEHHEHHHHDHGEECSCGHEHEHHEHHHHDQGEECSCGCGHEHHHHHHADEVFTSWGVETPRKYTQAEVQEALDGLDENQAGIILRAKGILPAADGSWLHFDYVPGEAEIRTGSADVTGRLCVIGSELKTDVIANLFHVNA